MFTNFFTRFNKNIIESFSGYNILWHLLAIGLTFLLVISGFDWYYFENTRNTIVGKITLSAGIIGFLVPIFLPICIYLFNKTKNAIIALGVAQAGIIGYLISILYKSLTGRIQPEFMTFNSMVDISREFNFGFLENGIFWGWPSSHTAVAFAMSFALITLYPNKKHIKYMALLYALYIGIGASIGFHWFSDFVAGAIIGSLVGIVVGKSFLTQTSKI